MLLSPPQTPEDPLYGRGDTKAQSSARSWAKDMSRVPLKKRKYIIDAAASDSLQDYEVSCTTSGQSSYPESPQDQSTLHSPGRASHPDSLQDLSTLNSPPQTPPAVHGCSSSTSQVWPFRPHQHNAHSPLSCYPHETSGLQYPAEAGPELRNSCGSSSGPASPMFHPQAATNQSPGLSLGYSSLWSSVPSTYTATSSPRVPSYPSTASPMPSHYSSSTPSPMSSSYNANPYRVTSNYTSPSTLSPMMSDYSLASSPAGSEYPPASSTQFHCQKEEHSPAQSCPASTKESPGAFISNSPERISSEPVKKQPRKSLTPPSQVPVRPDLPKDLLNFLPPNLLQSVGSTSSSSDPKNDKKHKTKKFTYRIDGKPLHAVTKEKSSGGRSRINLITKTLGSCLKSDSELDVQEEPEDKTPYDFALGFEKNPSEALVPSRPSSNFENLGSGAIPLNSKMPSLPHDKLAATVSSCRSRFTVAQEDQDLSPNVIGIKRKKQQKCRYCTNHNIFVPVKGHKYNCEYRDCTCKCCVITRQRQIAVKEQQRQTRRQEASRAMRQVEEQARFPAAPAASGHLPTSQYQTYEVQGTVGASPGQTGQGFYDADHSFSQEYIGDH